ncbi:DUF305 domain-containing protein [Amycolatopsis thermophila]|uniref:Uncharacterized protein (DUF305 family) n=1 Tax=Amycolatopsis thermophila TaxID=206084 RepID=A0ABU0F350_9PSEU|nr:DUF305 domain-containing protein [Amycolatopsis thermophila]MDQ0382006.1 uncharacterized protein (DUF305 family) [Amycolatopsis thermophila]
MKKTFVGTGIAVAVAGLVLAACSGGDDHGGMDMGNSSAPVTSSAPAQSATHNDADVTFAQEMIQHHQQALDMAKLVPTRSTNNQVKDLASRIERAQDPEIQQMQGWLTQWNAAMSTMPSMSGMHMPSTSSMPGMMSDADMQMLEHASGAEFDKMWLQMMVEHHQGAVEMARTELANGANADAKALAQAIIDAQTAEITEMQQLLTTL